MRKSDDRYLHITHLHPVPMTEILASLSESLGLPLVHYSEWLDSLEGASSQESAASNPGVRLIDFFRSYREVPVEQEAFFPAALSNTRAIKAAESMKSLAPLTAQDAKDWVSRLRQVGYLS